MNPTSKGFTTSEFAAMVGGIVASILVTAGVISAPQATSLTPLIGSVITGAIALVGIWQMVNQYIAGRNALKQTMLEKGIGTVAPVIPQP